MTEQQPLFEIISEQEFHKPTPRKRGHKTEPRTLTTWYALAPHTMGFCTVPAHDSVQELLNPGEKEYRQMYPTRMTFEIDGLMVCRDCFMHEADKL